MGNEDLVSNVSFAGLAKRPRGLKPVSIWVLYAALKRRSSTVVQRFVVVVHGAVMAAADSGFLAALGMTIYLTTTVFLTTE